jgi:2-polyprenyl-6-methoxyphenol hydroxylase-like FAD-dependent oxidoreductase
MAGQGANLGFADVATLLRVLRERSVLSGVGDLAVLRRYERARREDAATMGAATHGLHLLYRAEGHWLKRLRNQGLDIVNRLPIVKSLLTDHAAR